MSIQKNDNTIVIHKASIDDQKIIADLGKKTFDQSYGTFFKNKKNLSEYLESSFSLDKIANSLEKSDNLYWLVRDKQDDAPIGYAKVKLNSPSEFIDSNHVSKLQRIYLLKGYEGKGIGSELHHFILEEVTKTDSTHIWLSNLKIKSQAVAFYKGKSYQIAGEHRFTIGDETFDFWAMYKCLK
ncbi:GNAT family N-acetyltransferase [Aquimarina algicola]|uniref:GNAT family N-acetyltransferase n=1 Tax=Aquimarina algicola TaxID=2589995 RepID=A0A504JLU8_9FLAO|nr:GNAT family N-acetyltransferase [Aquimarina algicola]TPN88758.1 GNAT family N-acetyltransferase [Aquimarina algicola]